MRHHTDEEFVDAHQFFAFWHTESEMLVKLAVVAELCLWGFTVFKYFYIFVLVLHFLEELRIKI